MSRYFGPGIVLGCDYLMGGERTDLEVAHFPHHGKVLIGHPDYLYLIDEEALEKKTLEEWISESRPAAEDQAPSDD